ncbi:hypothetical protein I3842_13G117400 [Carya illinoinensis]|uniref:Uncharacterized protein n=1 Tax=Carya illinoinensis TaxID=32201 RepID=A0A922AM48_CARIL|nr:hypothetical protein I3842_13G117400 [Carya illinoinensis]
MPAHFDDTSDLNAVESLTPTDFICSTSPFSDDDYIFQTPEFLLDEKIDHINEDDFDFFDCFADSSLPLEVQFAGARWKPQFEALPPPDMLKSSEEEVPQLELKPLPQDLKYVFLGPEEGTFPVVISSKLNQKDEAQLIKVLRKHRGAIESILKTMLDQFVMLNVGQSYHEGSCERGSA